MSYEIKKEALTEVWGKMRVADIAKQFSVSDQSVYYWARKHGLPSRLDKDFDDDEGCPSEDEIREMAAAIRDGWSDEERERRTVCRTKKSVDIRCYSMSSLFARA